MKTLGYYNGKYDEIDKIMIPMSDRSHWFGDGDNGEVREYYYKSADADVYGYTMHPYEDWISSKMTEKKGNR